MKVFYNSKLARFLTFMDDFGTIMFLGMVFTENTSLSQKSLKHEYTHVQQYCDCFAVGGAISVITAVILFALGIQSVWMLFLLVFPPALFYILYGIEFIIRLCILHNAKEAYKCVSFERHARWIADTWYLPCEEQNHYVSFDWFRFINQ